MWTYNYSDTLCHHGVKGMKWGVRHDKQKSGGVSKPQYMTKSMERELYKKVMAETDFSSGSSKQKSSSSSAYKTTTSSRGQKQKKSSYGNTASKTNKAAAKAYKKELKRDAQEAMKKGIQYEVSYDKKTGGIKLSQAYIGANKKISEKRRQEIERYIRKKNIQKRAVAGISAGLISAGMAYASR